MVIRQKLVLVCVCAGVLLASTVPAGPPNQKDLRPFSVTINNNKNDVSVCVRVGKGAPHACFRTAEARRESVVHRAVNIRMTRQYPGAESSSVSFCRVRMLIAGPALFRRAREIDSSRWRGALV